MTHTLVWEDIWYYMKNGNPGSGLKNGGKMKLNEDASACPEDRELAEICRSLGLDVYRALCLVLKGRWERLHYSRNGLDSKSWYGLMMGNFPDGQLSGEFAGELERGSGIMELYRIFREYMLIARDFEYSSFENLALQLAAGNYHLMAAGNNEIGSFIRRYEREQSFADNGADDSSEAFWIKKCEWLKAEDELEELLMELENRRLYNANVDRQWMEVYGDAWLPMMEVYYRLQSVKLRYELKKSNPSLPWEEIYRLEEENLAEERDELEGARLKLDTRILTGLPQGVELSPEVLSSYRGECKKVLREIWRLTHEDCNDVSQLTEKQKKKIRDYYEKSVSIRDNEVGYSLRSLDTLYDILDSVKALWDNMGVDIEENRVIRGDTQEERLQWLERKLGRLEEQKRSVRNEIYVLTVDRNIKEKEASLEPGADITGIRAQMDEKRHRFEEEAKSLEKELYEKF